MNVFAARLIGDDIGEEGDKLLAGMARGSFAYHFAIASVKRGVQRKGAVAVVLKTMALEPPRRLRRNRRQAYHTPLLSAGNDDTGSIRGCIAKSKTPPPVSIRRPPNSSSRRI